MLYTYIHTNTHTHTHTHTYIHVHIHILYKRIPVWVMCLQTGLVLWYIVLVRVIRNGVFGYMDR